MQADGRTNTVQQIGSFFYNFHHNVLKENDFNLCG
jgi:hypothetical protein